LLLRYVFLKNCHKFDQYVGNLKIPSRSVGGGGGGGGGRGGVGGFCGGGGGGGEILEISRAIFIQRGKF